MKKLLPVFAALSLMSCGPSWVTIAVAIDNQNWLPGSLPATCFASTAANSIDTDITNLRADSTWRMWTGPDSKTFLEISNLGTAADALASVYLGGGAFGAPSAWTVLESSDGKTFNATYKTKFTNPADTSITSTDTTTVNVTFSDNGPTPKGTMTLSVARECTGCDAEAQFSCAPSAVNFYGRKIEADVTATVSPDHP